MMKNARETALQALTSFRCDGAWPDLYLKKACVHMPAEEAALASALVYGVLQNRSWIDFLIGSFSARPIQKITPKVLDILRIGAYQLLFLTRIPHSAAVNEAVKLVKATGNTGAAGYANGVLRSLERNLEALPEVPKDNLLDYLSVRYSHPKWFVGKMNKRLGAEACEKLLQADNEPVPAAARVNTLKTNREALLEQLSAEGIAASPHPYLPDAVIFEKMKGVLQSKALADGLFYIQDAASQLCVAALDPQPGDFLLDLCAAPGGKSMLAAQLMQNQGRIVSTDLYEHKSRLIEENAQKYGISCLNAHAADAAVLKEALLEKADRIICDVPCSGMGVIRKKPDIRFKDGDEIKVLPPLQLSILENAGRYLKPGGHLVYSTCTVLKEENEAVVQKLLDQHPEFSLESFVLPGIGEIPEGMLTLWPHVYGTDGFFMAKIKKA